MLLPAGGTVDVGWLWALYFVHVSQLLASRLFLPRVANAWRCTSIWAALKS